MEQYILLGSCQSELRRRLQENPLTIRLKLPGHNIVKVLGGSRVDAGVVARVTAKFFGLHIPGKNLFVYLKCFGSGFSMPCYFLGYPIG